MGNRLSKIVTRTGDDGTTGLGDGSRTRKDDARVNAYGSVDETNSAIGVLLTHTRDHADVSDQLIQIQHDLFDLGGELSIPGYTLVKEANVTRIENWLEAFNEDLPPLKNFILPGGSPASAHCHLARAISRRAERETVHLAQSQSVNPHSLHYLNRLSDYLFVLARHLQKASGLDEVLWQQDCRKEGP